MTMFKIYFTVCTSVASMLWTPTSHLSWLYRKTVYVAGGLADDAAVVWLRPPVQNDSVLRRSCRSTYRSILVCLNDPYNPVVVDIVVVVCVVAFAVVSAFVLASVEFYCIAVVPFVVYPRRCDYSHTSAYGHAYVSYRCDAFA